MVWALPWLKPLPLRLYGLLNCRGTVQFSFMWILGNLGPTHWILVGIGKRKVAEDPLRCIRFKSSKMLVIERSGITLMPWMGFWKLLGLEIQGSWISIFIYFFFQTFHVLNYKRPQTSLITFFHLGLQYIDLRMLNFRFFFMFSIVHHNMLMKWCLSQAQWYQQKAHFSGLRKQLP